jgi:putative membrane protein (TIGR04086 family)
MTQFRWLRILVGGFLSELALFAVFIPATIVFGEKTGVYTAVVGSFITPFLFGIWTARRVKSQFVLHGALVGIVGVVIYLGLTRLQPEPLVYVFAHLLKLGGGSLGGYVAQMKVEGASGSLTDPTTNQTS